MIISSFFAAIDKVSATGFFIAAVLFVLAVGLVLYRFRRAPEGRKFHQWLASGAELILLLVLLLVSLIRPSFSPPESAFYGAISAAGTHHKPIEGYLALGLTVTAVLGALLVVTRLVRNRLLFLVTAALLIIGGFGIEYHREASFVVVAKAMCDEARLDVDLLPRLLLPGPIVQVAKLSIWGLLCFLGGLYFVRRGYAWWKFALGSLLTGWLVVFALVPLMFGCGSYLVEQPIAFTVVGLAIVTLPFQRRRLEHLLQFPLHQVTSPEEPAVPRERSLGVQIIGHLILLGLALTLAGLAYIGQAEFRQLDLELYGPPPQLRAASDVNAYPYFKGHFLRDPDFKLPNAFAEAAAAENGVSDGFRDTKYWNGEGGVRTRKALIQISEWLDAMTTASMADYFEPPKRSTLPEFLAMRECSRAMVTRAFVRMLDGDTTGALVDMQATLRFGGVLKDNPLLLSQMIGIAIRGMATRVGYEFYRRFKNDSAAMEAFRETLESNREVGSSAVNWVAILRGDAGLQPVVPNADTMLPAFLRAYFNALGRLAQFGQLRIAVALECYKARHGAYPVSLDALAPELLQRVPVDPYKGRPYEYKVEGGQFSMMTHSATEKVFDMPYVFPLRDETTETSAPRAKARRPVAGR